MSSIGESFEKKTNCSKCGQEILINDKFCGACGNPLSDNSFEAIVEELYLKNEEDILKTLIIEEANKGNYNINAVLPEMKKRKMIISIIFAVLSLLFISLVFFHISDIFIFLVFINLIIYLIIIRSFNTIRYLLKEVKSRPDEDLTYVVSSSLSMASNFKYEKIVYLCMMVISVALPMFVFSKPHYFYEDTIDGYYLRFYTTGLIQEETITIPSEYKGKKVIGIRGNVFMNLRSLKTINLPDTIEIIRGHAFDGDVRLTSVNLPSNLQYLGGGAFKNCKSLKSINIPNSITEIYGNTFENSGLTSIVLHDGIANIGGGAFKNSSSLESVILSQNITEIHGNTFENCTSLKKITIPDSVTRIGGHAFYGNSSLSEVFFSEDSKLMEIGSSAFRLCDQLYSITLPNNNISINSRAFKESPTQIHYLGEIAYGNLINKDNYHYYTTEYIRVGNTEELSEYHRDSVIYGTSLTLDNITVSSEGSEFNFTFNGKDEDFSFVLNASNPYYIISDNLAVEVESKYAFTSSESILLNVYFN